jgi:hypothetical protein
MKFVETKREYILIAIIVKIAISTTVYNVLLISTYTKDINTNEGTCRQIKLEIRVQK